MKKGPFTTQTVVIVLLWLAFSGLTACSKNSNIPPGQSSSSLWPLKAGNTWLYKDSLFNDTALITTYPDTVTVTSKTYTDPNTGMVYNELYNPAGWFGYGSYVAVDPDNTTIYEYDSTGASPYLFFGTTYGDGVQIGSGTDFTNAACPVQYVQYGFISTYNINGYTCLKNIQYATNCNNVNTEAIVTYVSPGAGVVRMEDYQADSTRNNALYLNFSQTLQSQKPY